MKYIQGTAIGIIPAVFSSFTEKSIHTDSFMRKMWIVDTSDVYEKEQDHPIVG